jgi:hypothetical protein
MALCSTSFTIKVLWNVNKFFAVLFTAVVPVLPLSYITYLVYTSTLKMEVRVSSKMLLPLHLSAWCNIPEGYALNIH